MTRSRLRAATGSLGFVFFGGPTIVAGLVPWLLTRWHTDHQTLALRILGAFLLGLGALLVIETTARFALQGRGTPAPWAPPTEDADNPLAELAPLVIQIGKAAFQVASVGDHAQREQARALLADTRRALYRLLAEEASEPDAGEEPREV